MANPELFSDRTLALDFLMWAKKELLQADEDASVVMKGRDEVLAKFGPVFRHAGDELNEDVVKRFLSFTENCHWTGLYRQQTAILSNFERAKEAIKLLVQRREFDDDIVERFDKADQMVRGFGQGIISPILFVAFPNHYGVWNSKSEFGLNRLGLGIVSDRGDTPGRKYLKVNNALLQARAYLNKQVQPGDHPVDLWTIDYFWHAIKVMSDDGRLTNLVARFNREQ